jgi:predicted nucleic acid-binding protein
MQTVVSDTGPLNYLILIEADAILARLFESVVVPPAVREELSHRAAPAAVRAWIAHPPSWLTVATPNSSLMPELSYLDAGEREVIALALERDEMLLLVDDRHATTEARNRGLEVIGTLAALDRAAARGWVSLPEMFNRLRNSSFRAPLRLMARMLEEDALRRE